MKTGVVGQLGVECRGEDAALADRDRMSFVAGQHLDPRPVALDPGGANEDRAQRLVADSLDLEVGLEALQLAPEGVAARRRVDEAEVIGVADDQPGAGAEDRSSGLVVRAERRLQTGRRDALGDRRTLAAGDDEAVESLQLGRGADLGQIGGTELAQRAGVCLEIALQR
jgi:hypothetical protein